MLVVLAVFSAAAWLGLAGAVRGHAAAAWRLALFEAATTTQASNTAVGVRPILMRTRVPPAGDWMNWKQSCRFRLRMSCSRCWTPPGRWD